MARMPVVVVSAAVIFAAGCASVETGPPPDVAGRWTGQCYGCPVRAFSLVLTQSGDQLTGSMQPSGRSGLGESEKPLLNGKVAGSAVTFQIMGDDGVPLTAELRVSRDGQTMAGQGQHRSGFGLNFTRTGR